jgi:hypothetical protein
MGTLSAEGEHPQHRRRERLPLQPFLRREQLQNIPHPRIGQRFLSEVLPNVCLERLDEKGTHPKSLQGVLRL